MNRMPTLPSLVAVLLLTGCESPSPRPPEGPGEAPGRKLEVPRAQDTGALSTARAKGTSGGELELSYAPDTSILTVRLRNIGTAPLVVDRELVFLLDVRLIDASGKEIRWTPGADKPFEAGDWKNKDRFVSVKPGEHVARVIDLRKGFTQFSCAVGTMMTDSAEFQPPQIHAGEGTVSLEGDKTPAKIVVSYRMQFHDYPLCFSSYTGLGASDLGLYEGPLEATVTVNAR